MTPRTDLDEQRHVLATLQALPNQLRQGIADALWSRIPTYVEEYEYNAGLADGATLEVRPEFGALVRIEDVVATVPSGATGLVQLGARVFPVGAGVTSFSVGAVMQANDTRTLTIAGATGPAALYLAGVQLGASGVISQ